MQRVLKFPFSDKAAKCQLAAERDFLGTAFSLRFMSILLARRFGGRRRDRAPPLLE